MAKMQNEINLAGASCRFLWSLDWDEIINIARSEWGEGFEQKENFFPINEYGERSINPYAIRYFVWRTVFNSFGDADSEEALEFIDEWRYDDGE